MDKALEALERLKAGNHRYVTEVRAPDSYTFRARRAAVAVRQEPFAIILGCSDSRAPAEIVFDQGLGDLFVIRVAGNIVAPSQIGSVEFAVHEFNTQLVVVLGHSDCGAVHATLDALKDHSEAPSPNIGSIVSRIRPSVEALLESDLKNNSEELMNQAVRSNIRASVNSLRRGSDILKPLISNGELLVVGAEYSLETGIVDFFEGIPAVSSK
jgi:carbonic anhydrase